MRRFTKFVAVVALFVSAIACDTPEGPDSIQNGNGPLLKIDAKPAGDYTRATDTAFEQGDSFGLFAIKGEGFDNITADNFADVLLSMEAWITNAKFTKGKSGFSGDQEYKWYEGDQVSSFAGIYPYGSDCTAGDVLFVGIDFCVKSDQSTHAGYTASDLMVAYKDGVAPTAETVTLSFNHQLSKLVIDLNNQTGEQIKEVYVDGVRGNYTYSLIGSSVTGNCGTIKAGELATPSSGFTDTFVLIIPPQSAAPKVAITTESGKQYTFEAPEELDFGVSKKRQITVTLTSDSISTDFDAIVNDWSADESVEFTDQPGGGDAPSEGSYTIIAGEKQYPMTYDHSSGLYTTTIEIPAEGVVLSVLDEPTQKRLGGNFVSTVTNIYLSEEGEPITIPSLGYEAEFEVAIDPDYDDSVALILTPIRIGVYEYIGEGSFVEGYYLGVMTPCDVLYYETDNEYYYLLPMTPIAHTLIQTSPDAYREGQLGISPYVLVRPTEATYKGWPYTGVSMSSPVQTGMQTAYNGEWYDLYYRMVDGDLGRDAIFNRALCSTVLQTAPIPTLNDLGSFTGALSSNGVFSFVLPGATFNDRKFEWVDVVESFVATNDNNEQLLHHAIYIEEDVVDVKICVLTNMDINDDNFEEVANLLIEDDLLVAISSLGWSNSGVSGNIGITSAFESHVAIYTMIAVGIDEAGQPTIASYYNYINEQAVGDREPCQNISMEVSLDSVRPDTQICFEMKGSDITSAYYSCLPAEEYGQLNDQDLVAAALSVEYRYLLNDINFVNDVGYTELFVNLEPETEYVVVGWFEDAAGGYSVIRNNITTDKATEWVSLGTGSYFDGTHLFLNADNEFYTSEVEIMQDSDGSDHYRIKTPYANYWNSTTEQYAGFYDEWLEVALYTMTDADGNTMQHICYDPYYTGKTEYYEDKNVHLIVEHQYNCHGLAQIYPMRDKQLSAYTSSTNRVLSEGVLQLSPWYMLEGYGIGYNYNGTNEAIVIALPGYTFEPTPMPESVAPINGVHKSSVAPSLTPYLMTDGGGVVRATPSASKVGGRRSGTLGNATMRSRSTFSLGDFHPVKAENSINLGM